MWGRPSARASGVFRDSRHAQSRKRATASSVTHSNCGSRGSAFCHRRFSGPMIRSFRPEPAQELNGILRTRGYPKTRIHEVGQRACARLIDGGRARASALAYEDSWFRIGSTQVHLTCRTADAPDGTSPKWHYAQAGTCRAYGAGVALMRTRYASSASSRSETRRQRPAHRRVPASQTVLRISLNVLLGRSAAVALRSSGW
jgi:hypothetical protein